MNAQTVSDPKFVLGDLCPWLPGESHREIEQRNTPVVFFREADIQNDQNGMLDILRFCMREYCFHRYKTIWASKGMKKAEERTIQQMQKKQKNEEKRKKRKKRQRQNQKRK